MGPAKASHDKDSTEYLDSLYGNGVVLSRNSAKAGDLVQKTCLRALHAIDGLREQGSVKSWLFTILRNIWLNQLLQRSTAPDLIELDGEDHDPIEPADAGQDGNVTTWLTAAANWLPNANSAANQALVGQFRIISDVATSQAPNGQKTQVGIQEFLTAQSVPEPGEYGVLALGLGVLFCAVRRQRRRS